MAEHQCKHEAEIAGLSAEVRHACKELKAAREDMREFFNTLKGNGKPGLITEVALIKQRQGLIWAAISSAGTGVLGIIGWLIKEAFK